MGKSLFMVIEEKITALIPKLNEKHTEIFFRNANLSCNSSDE